MDTIKSITRNTTWLFISYAVSSFFNLFYNMYIAIYLDPDGYGLLNFSLALVGIFNVLADLGISSLATRDVARNNDLAYKFFDSSVKIKTALSTLAFGAIAVVAILEGYTGPGLIVIFLIAIGNLVNSFSVLYNAIFQAFEKMEYQSIGGILSSFLMLAGALYAMYAHLSIVSFAVLYLAVNVFMLIFYTLICQWKFFTPKLTLGIDRAFVSEIIKEGWPMGALAVSIAIFSRIDTVILGFMNGTAAVGIYSAAYKLSELSTIIPIIFTSAAYPIIAKYYQSSQSSFKYTFEKSTKFLFYIAIPMAFLVTLLADLIVALYYKGSYADSANALKILIWAAVGMYLTIILGNTMISANLQKLQMNLVILTAIVNVVLNLIVISFYGYLGASVAMVITQWLLVISYFYYLDKNGYKINLKELLLPPVLALFVMTITAVALNSLSINILLISLACMVEYALIVLPLGAKKDDIELVKNILKFDRSKV
jgi:O-antigen/teichoic acid export membrane protein